MKIIVGSGNNTTFSQVTDRSSPSRISVTTSPTTDVLARETANLAYSQANSAYEAANVANNGANTVHIFANGSSILSNSTLNFNNTISVNVDATANGTLQTNVAFIVNTSSLGLENYVQKAGDTMTGSLNVQSSLNVAQQIYANTIDFGPYELASNTFETMSNSTVEIDSFSASLYSTVKYIIQIKTTNSLHSTELFCIQDGISSYMSEYATLISGSPLGNFSVELSGGRMRLIFYPLNSLGELLKVKMVRYTIAS
jgi:hypothetical protein